MTSVLLYMGNSIKEKLLLYSTANRLEVTRGRVNIDRFYTYFTSNPPPEITQITKLQLRARRKSNYGFSSRLILILFLKRWHARLERPGDRLTEPRGTSGGRLKLNFKKLPFQFPRESLFCLRANNSLSGPCKGKCDKKYSSVLEGRVTAKRGSWKTRRCII